MKNQTHHQHLTLSLGAIVCAAVLFGCSHNTAPLGTSTKTSGNTSTKLYDNPTAVKSEEYVVEDAIELHEGRAEVKQHQLISQQIAPAVVKLTAGSSVHSTMLQPVKTSQDRYASIESNPVKRASEDPVSTFSLDVDTGSYAVVRRHLQHGQLPPADAVRVEELINYFNYNTPTIKDKKRPFAFKTELANAPWHEARQLLRVSVAAWQQPMEDLPPSNLVFLVDVSGSMQSTDKLPLLKSSLKLLVNQMRAEDSVSLVAYAGSSAVILEPTKGSNKHRITNAIDSLGAGGGTHGAAGLKDAYRLAGEHKIADGINRVILATDGDFNVGMSDTNALLDYIKKQRKLGITLTTLGFGQGNYNDHLMEQLADHGNGNHAYIDTLSEARKVLMEQVGATLFTVASDAKIQVEFNPDQVSEYKLLGYENRLLREQDFNDDKVDAGDIGAGHTITALYELSLRGSGGERFPDRRYTTEETNTTSHSDELAWVKLRYKPRGSDISTLLEQKIKLTDLSPASPDFKFASSVAAWGDWLRQPGGDSEYTIDEILKLAVLGKGEDRHGYRSEYIQLLKLSAAMRSTTNASLARN